MTARAPGQLVSLQIGRGLAALAVAAFHLAVLMQAPAFGGSPMPWLSIFDEGHLGVDFFFVLSGFIIMHAHEADIGRPDRLQRYGYRRGVRIYPIYWVYLAACLLGMLVVKSAHFALTNPSDWLTAVTLVRFSTIELPLHQAWTLFHEMLFYAMFALLIVNRVAGLAAMAAWFGSIAYLDTRYAGAGESFYGVLTSSANLNFLAGIAAYKAMQHLTRPYALGLFAAGVVLLFAGAWQYGVAFGLLLAGATALERAGLPLWLGFIGDASYSIYLLHEHIENYAARALAKVAITPTSHPVTMFGLVLVFVTIGGCVAYVMIERPLVNALRRRSAN